MHKKFLMLSMVSSIVELGVLTIAYREGGGVFEILLVALAYQLGNLSLNLFASNKKSIHFFSLLLLIAFLSQSLSLLVFVTSFYIQLLRDESKTKVSIFRKRTFRIIGFFFAPLLNLWALQGLVVIIYVFSMVKKLEKLNKENIILRWIMILHQMHYFFYCYVFVYILILRFGNQQWYYIGSAFILGWLTYIMSQKIWRSLYSKALLGATHLALAGILGLMFLMRENIIILLMLWVMTGIFGGTVYIISYYYRKYGLDEKLHQDENVGHVLGVSGALLIVVLRVMPEITFLISSLLAFSVGVISLTLFSRRFQND